MSVKTLCLAILNCGDTTGYEIRKHLTEGDFCYFEDASYGSIYPTLARLETEGLVTVREEPQPGKPARKVYSITDAGRAAFREALAEPPGPDTFRSPFLLVAMWAELAGPDVIRQALDERICNLKAEIAKLTAIRDATSHPGTGFIVEYGLNCMTNDLAFLEREGERLIRIASGADAGLPQAAE
ncbi:PadR family transcriptional regulator [Stappia sp. F7233]|uniref:PadR family transcriptional regulator n=1 Tax=Stappia albiluteola TaxID=2758565 RepID=A0A839AHR4_9HYPH|nr:PadR family transcriptional regulator [Stappia albiluteola]MBA5779390.1 PadR family transcriptional regulator [Stappia albiluteola]